MDDRITENMVKGAVNMLNCALHNKKVDDDFLSIYDPEDLLLFCRFHGISALASLSLKNDPWEKERMKALRRTVLYDCERKKIIDFFEQNGIWYCLLKGIVLKDFYPVYGTREMSDNDILIDAEKKELIRRYMAENGYSLLDAVDAKDDAYYKEPIYNFQMHNALFDGSQSQTIIAYFTDIKNRLLKDEHDQFAYHFTDEDFYIYYIAHNHDHLYTAGSGFRTLVDIYLYINRFKNLNWQYIERELMKLDLDKEEKLTRGLSIDLFSEEQKELSKKEEQLLNYMAHSGMIGSGENLAENKLRRFREQSDSKLFYIFRRIYPSEDVLRVYFPFFYRHVWARPFLVLFRIGRAAVFKRNRTVKELKTIKNMGDGSTIDSIFSDL